MELRTRALARRGVPDELDRLLRIGPPSMWVTVSAMALAVAALLVWGFSGHIPRSMAANGVLTGARGPWIVQSPGVAQVRAVLVSPGSTVHAGQPVLQVRARGSRSTSTLRAPAAGLVSNVDVAAGEVVGRSRSLYTLEPPTSANQLQAVLFLSRQAGAVIAPGMKTDVSVNSAPSAGFGVMRGVVESVSSYPASTQALTAILGNSDLALAYGGTSAPLVARIRLLGDPSTRSGLRWSTRSGPPFPVEPGTGVSAHITEQEQTPIDVLFGSN